MPTIKDKVRLTYEKSHATKHDRHGLKGSYWLIWSARSNGTRIGTGETETAAWKDALQAINKQSVESGEKS
jgi:hypothetical protein